MSNLSKMNHPDFYDEVYFESGAMFGKSCYSHFRWMPEPTYRMAMAMIEHTGLRRGEKVLDFGCAKGFLVKALRGLFREAYGCDCSRYAIQSADAEIRDFLQLSTASAVIPFSEKFALCISKDVFEHLSYQELSAVLAILRKQCQNLLTVVPLGHKNKYVIDAYEHDASHIIREDSDWWVSQIEASGFKTKSVDFHVEGVKDNWQKVHPKGNVVIFSE
jgi:cyclopropane fatty-acyl-phospholipid synthase-like methyltransferase